MRRSLLTGSLLLLAAAVLTGCRNVSDKLANDHYAEGVIAMDGHDYRRALAELELAVRLNPKLSVAHTAMGDIYRKQQQPALAADAYSRACRANPYAFRPHYNLGVMYQLLADAAAAPGAAGEYLRKAVRIYLRAVSLRPDDFGTNLNLSACYYRQGKLALAEQYCKTAIELDPEQPFAYSNLGTIHSAQGRPYDAIAAYKASLERDTHQPKLLLNLGATYLELDRMKEAMRVFELAAEEDPDSAEPQYQIGRCHHLNHDYDAAQAAYERAIRLDDRCAPAYRCLGLVHMTQWVLDPGKTDLREKALEAWHRSLELESNQPDLLELIRKYQPPITGPGP